MWISSTTQYALRAVLFVAEHGAEQPVRVEAIAGALNLPRNYLSKTLHALARAGVLRSERGPRGGFQLSAPPNELTLARVAAPFGDLESRRCLLGRPSCGGQHPCPVHPQWEAVARSLQAFFRETTLAQVLGELTPNPPSNARRAARALPRRAKARIHRTSPPKARRKSH